MRMETVCHTRYIRNCVAFFCVRDFGLCPSKENQSEDGTKERAGFFCLFYFFDSFTGPQDMVILASQIPIY